MRVSTLEPPSFGLSTNGCNTNCEFQKLVMSTSLPLGKGTSWVRKNCLYCHLSKQSSEAATPEPTYVIPMSSNCFCRLPSSPPAPCRTGKATSACCSLSDGSP